MPTGTGAITLQNIPAEPFVMSPGDFFAMTEKNVVTPLSVGHPGAGGFFTRSLPQVGIKSKVRLIFVGSLTVATAAVTTSDRWPHGLLDDVRLSANAQTDLISCSGEDLHALRFLRYPAYAEDLDVFAGSVGGGNSVSTGTTALYLTWELPIAMDDTTLIGSLFAQSAAANIGLRVQAATNAQLFSANPGNATITGTWYVQETFYDIPFDSQNRLVVPDLTKLHGFVANDVPFTAVGDVKTPLIRSAGQMMRLMVAARSSATNRLTADPAAATSRLIDEARLEYGGNQRPLQWSPAATLLGENQNYYGGLPPYDRHILDFVRENPTRDVVNLLGVTDLNMVLRVNSGVTVSAGSVRCVQETLY